MDELVAAGVNDAISNYVSESDLIDIVGVPIEELDPDVQMWIMLNGIVRVCGNPQTALRSLLWYEVMTICELRFKFFEVDSEGRLIRKRNLV